MPGITSDTKVSFGRLLVYLTTVLTPEGTMQYTKTLLNFTRAGLEAEGKYEGERKKRIDDGFNKYRVLISTISKLQPSQVLHKNMTIMDMCSVIDYDILALAQSEGIIELTNASFNFGSMLGVGSEDE